MGQEDVTKTTTGQAQGDDRADLLVRQVQNKVALEGKHTDNSVAVSLGKLFTAATGTEKCRIYFGWLFACITGAALPCFFFFLGPVFDSFGPETDPEETRRKVRELCIIMGILAIGVCLTSFLQNYLLMSTSASVGGRLKTKYLEKVLN
jgi:ABC-type multidrug transport system fused ATPase/permease subunit